MVEPQEQPADMKIPKMEMAKVEEDGEPQSSLPAYSRHSHIDSLERYINLPSVVNFGVIILASWESFAVTFQFALTNGGPASMFYGSILAGLGATVTGLSLAELSSIDPTVGAQYRWSANLAPAAPKFFGLIQGWITVSAWTFASAGPPSIIANMITSIAIFNYESYVPQRWHTTLIMCATIMIPLACNLWFRRFLNAFELIGGVIHIALFVIVIAVLAALGPKSSPDFVFKTLTHDVSGWSNPGVSWGLGLLSATFSVTGFDAVIHMSDEVKQVHNRVPRSIVVACALNSAMLVIFVLVLLFFCGPLDNIAATPLPLIYILYGATGSKAGTNVLVAFIMLVNFFALFNIFASVSRLIWCFSKDKGLPFSNCFSYVSPHFGLPVNSLFLVGGIIILLSFIYMASATAFNALISLQALALQISYLFPILFMLLRKIRGPTPQYGPFRLGRIGAVINLLALMYLIYVATWMPFPQLLPVTKDNMNYAGPVFGAVLVLALCDWFVSGRKRFEVPLRDYATISN
ncbi:hypothetical protein GYMLUDRAFT_251252 [Collybiopsis luxurians FD-317 M1]|uniref:Amino acid transporter n=1 Tax=Collybiopsis luxurians FD-317 M1 TaxID=944289 RepID=A0A0D0BS34_9AGAR|nr:hypothetical protein GYMLUDRAFT_251252 [Collybiopsis luxurians FD-317 M1]